MFEGYSTKENPGLSQLSESWPVAEVTAAGRERKGRQICWSLSCQRKENGRGAVIQNVLLVATAEDKGQASTDAGILTFTKGMAILLGHQTTS